MKIDNIDEVEEFAKEMNYFFTYIERTNSDLKNELRIKELEQDDLLHEIELSKLNAFELSKVAVRLRNVRQERRVIKDKLEFISTLKGFADKYNNKLITGDIAQLLKNIRNLKENWETRIYKTRVLEALNNAIKKELENQRLEKENETLKKLHIQDNNKLDFVMKHCILEQKIKDKIEELNKKEQKLQNSISAEEREEYSDANISWDLMDINIKREVLQDLIEGRK